MADRQRSPGGVSRASIRERLLDHLPNSTQVVGFLTLVISGGILLLLIGLTLTAALLGLFFLAPLILITSPVWVPLGAVLFVATGGFLSTCGLGVVGVAGASWLYSYIRGRYPVDYARRRISDTANHVKYYARQYSGYLQGRVKDAAPGA